MIKIVMVRLREAGNVVAYVAPDEVELNDYVIVEADRGTDYGEVLEINEQESSKVSKKVIRIANKDDLAQIEDNKKQAKNSIRDCYKKIEEFNLPMKLVEAEYSFDKKKIIFYFTSEERVDFRELVKDLAKVFKIRIEMRQIGVRDEARLFGGIGPCGRKLCCASFLKNFEAVSIKMAKQQKLPLNPSKISGICGRLMCCLFYEYKCYKECAKCLPKEGEIINTENGKAKVISVNILKRTVQVEYPQGKIETIEIKNKKDG